jgi:choline kinase
VILSAGRGSRLADHTADKPKCLLKLGTRTLLGWQVEMLLESGISSIAVVTGFGTEHVEREIEELRRPGLDIRAIYNPFFGVSDNLASCWIARAEMNGDFILLNGDTLFEAGVAQRLIASPAAAVTLAIDRKAGYDADDMKVQVSGGRLVNVAKTIGSPDVWGESIGMIRFRADGAAAFVAELEATIRGEKGLRSWYLSSVAALAQKMVVTVASISGCQWCEIDFPKDYAGALALSAEWSTSRAAAG